MSQRIGSFKEFKAFTLAVARGERTPKRYEPKVWIESAKGQTTPAKVRFRSLEAGAKLLSAKNRELLRTIAARRPASVSALAKMTGRAEQNLLRTLRKLTAAGIVRLDKGEGRAYRPVVTVRKVHFEIDVLADGS